jgi:hypothetical protein
LKQSNLAIAERMAESAKAAGRANGSPHEGADSGELLEKWVAWVKILVSQSG